MKEAFESFRDMNSEDLIKSHTLRTHSKKVMSIVENVITNYDVEFDKIKTDLLKLGSRHYIYGVREEFFYVSKLKFFKTVL